MRKRIIGVDIDGVITDESHTNDNIWHNALCEYLGTSIERQEDTYNFSKAYKLSDDILNKFLDQELINIYEGIKPLSAARQTLKYLEGKQFEIILITARHSEYFPLTETWLKQHNIPYSLLLHNEDKAPIAVDYNIQLFIEDHQQNALDISSKGIPVLLINKYHNLSLQETENIIRVDSWVEISKFVNSFFQLKQNNK